MAVQMQASARKPMKKAPVSFIEPERRCMLIAEAAYFRAEHRGFEPGHELDDWLAAESDIDGMLGRAECPVACSV